jgi:hypothetical protein
MKIVLVFCSALLLINLILHPYSVELEMLDIDAGINEDSIIVAIFVNSFSMVLLISSLVYTIMRDKKYIKWLICLAAINTGFIIYWLYYFNLG